ncbi:hypothetical protein JCM10212_005192 [Sporobolomyces blumeae]
MASEQPARRVPRPIAKLPEAVVNRIAAGEIIQRPANALKELIENALDAGSTSIRISVKEGGVKLLQIQDNGSGIRKEDLPILCERFTTSKIKVFEDLRALGTYGFRGEALASISHVAHLTITTKTKADACGWKAAYSDGQLVPVKSNSSDPSPVPTASNDGTTLVVEDLFFNTPQRLKSLRTASEEYGRIVSVALAYSIHNAGVAISCRRQNAGSTADVNTQVSASVLDNIGQAYGEAVRRELVEVKADDEELGIKLRAWCSGPNHSAKRGVYQFFINNRLVDCPPLKRALEAFYGTLLPKGGYPFVYLSLSIEPSKIDVNTHPTKQEVRFEGEDEIVEAVCEALAKALESQGESRSYKVQTLLPASGAARPYGKPSSQAPAPSGSGSGSGSSSTPSGPASDSTGPHRKTPKVAPQKLVRTDAQSQTLDSMFPVLANASGASSRSSKGKERAIDQDGGQDEAGSDGAEARASKRSKSDHDPAFAKVAAEEQARQMRLARVRIAQSECMLTSVRTLRANILQERDEELDKLFKNHIFVGVADVEHGLSMVQHQTKLYLVKHFVVAEQLLYQLSLRQFGRLSRIKLKPPPPLKKLLRLAVEREPSRSQAKLTTEQIVQKLYERIYDSREMLDEYFSLSVNREGAIEALPLVLPGHAPDLRKLPLFLLRIGVHVDWDRELECFESFATELSYFYSPQPLARDPTSPQDLVNRHSDDDSSGRSHQVRDEPREGEGGAEGEEGGEVREARSSDQEKRSIQNVFFPAFKQYLVPSRALSREDAVQGGGIGGAGGDGGGDRNDHEVQDGRRRAEGQGATAAVLLCTKLESLYKVFERC